MKIQIINGPNLNFLGKREPEIYGYKTLDIINNELEIYGKNYEIELEFFQSNHEGEIIDKIQEIYNKVDYLIINPGALTHYGIGIRDAILSTDIKTIEVHLSNVYSREKFRHKSVISDICIGKITGFGSEGYKMALQYLGNLDK
ncbi:type II 3-dehydroquinate dehydratase [Candidatus Cetobacterium colombiensis]|jgi:3-dehydroquinate dehydratase-2|uniref:3-dehydroquinate dehydratase n=1 Tax=Candidatus Cetobacterium colombiensis TaxID=3073100 RepID=A0ABU4WC31_9FUSO|nr:type II 3-dehydroquinate dehydratase [Candidatus Cetobacterium colombiensis]MDX8336249.1 type II 3-dehydroquinate dehydratase [Candidatus Cetobacterium colombiensis]